MRGFQIYTTDKVSVPKTRRKCDIGTLSTEKSHPVENLPIFDNCKDAEEALSDYTSKIVKVVDNTLNSSYYAEEFYIMEADYTPEGDINPISVWGYAPYDKGPIPIISR